MPPITTIARRTFVLGSVGVAGGFVLGWIAAKWPIANPLLPLLDEDDHTLNPYIRIDPSGITIITPRAELGQGAYSIQAALIAEELDVAWGDFAIDPGPPSRAYFNATVLAEGIPIASTNEGRLAQSARALAGVAAKVGGIQITGGSSTVPDAYEKLRRAGATARAMLLEAAARQTGVRRSELRTDRGAVVTPAGDRLPYTQLAAAASRLTPPSDVALKEPRAWTLLGTPMQRLDIVAKSTGTARFGIDLQLPKMLYATTRTNPRRGGGMTRYDAQRARSARGVVDVVPITDGFGVIADNTWRAFRGAQLVEVEWGGIAPFPDTAAMFAEVAASFTPERRDSRFRNDGDVDRVLVEQEGTTITAEYRLPFLAHAPLEPMNATVRLQDGTLEIWTGTQIPRFLVQRAAKLAGISEDRVILHAQISGGSFGRRLEDDYVQQAVQLAMAYPGRPIKMTWTREEDFLHEFPRPLAIGRAQGQVRDRKIHVLSLDVASPAVTASQVSRLGQRVPGPDGTIVAGAWDQPWAIPNYRVTGYRAPEVVPVSSWRSVGASITGFVHESFVDELCRAAGIDPLEERLRLCTHAPTRRVLEAIGTLSDWGSALGSGRGRGLALTVSFGVPCAEVVEVTDTPSGFRIDRVYVVAEVGKVLDPVNFENQVQGGVLWGLGHAMFGEVTYKDGVSEQVNFPSFGGLRMHQAPAIVVQGLETGAQVRGIGEPPVPPAAAALGNALYDASGVRVRTLPMHKFVTFV